MIAYRQRGFINLYTNLVGILSVALLAFAEALPWLPHHCDHYSQETRIRKRGMELRRESSSFPLHVNIQRPINR